MQIGHKLFPQFRLQGELAYKPKLFIFALPCRTSVHSSIQKPVAGGQVWKELYSCQQHLPKLIPLQIICLLVVILLCSSSESWSLLSFGSSKHKARVLCKLQICKALCVRAKRYCRRVQWLCSCAVPTIHMLSGAVNLLLFLIPLQALWLPYWRSCCRRRQSQTMRGVLLFGQHSTTWLKSGNSFRSTQTRQVLEVSWMVTLCCALKYYHQILWLRREKNDFFRPCIS